MSKSHYGHFTNASGGMTQRIADHKGKVCMANLCSYGSLASGLPPETDCLKIKSLGVELLVSKSHNGNIGNASGATARGIADPKGKVCGVKLCFSGLFDSGLPPETDCWEIKPFGVELLSVKVS